MTTAQMEQEDILGTAAQWRDAGRDVGLATVIATWGSSPRPVGSQLVVDGEGRFAYDRRAAVGPGPYGWRQVYDI